MTARLSSAIAARLALISDSWRVRTVRLARSNSRGVKRCVASVRSYAIQQPRPQKKSQNMMRL